MWTHEEEETQSGYKCAYYLPYIGRKWWKNGESSSKGDDFMTQSLSHPSALTISSFGPHSAVNINLLTHTCCHWIKFHSVICQDCSWSRVGHSSEEKLKLHNTQRISSANCSFNVLPQITASPQFPPPTSHFVSASQSFSFHLYLFMYFNYMPK